MSDRTSSAPQIDGANCASGGVSGGATDGQGIIIDRPDANNYTGVYTIENNLFVGNGSAGFAEFVNGTGLFPSNIVYRNNTSYGNLADPTVSGFLLGDIYIHNLGRAQVTRQHLAYPRLDQYRRGLFQLARGWQAERRRRP